jgi:LacI family transcriptional regulator
VEDVASVSDHLVLVGNTDEVEAEEVRYMRMLIQKGVDGVLFVPAVSGEEAIEIAQLHHIPVVVLDRRTTIENVDSIRCDSVQGAKELAIHLSDQGHSQFAILAGPKGNPSSDDRIKGFLSALQSEVDLEVLHGRFTVDEGARMMASVLQMSPRPTAVFATNNFIAIGAVNEVRRSGLRIPDDLSVVGFDDLPAHLITFPFLTVASQPAYEMGAEAARILLGRIKDAQTPFVHEILPTSLIIRSSTSPL